VVDVLSTTSEMFCCRPRDAMDDRT
jgi:hypothetical protein